MRLVYLLVLVFLVSCDSKETQLQRFLMQGNKALKDKDYQAAEYYLQQAINLEPCFADALNNLGVANSEQHHFDVAIDHFNKALSCNGKFLPAYFNRANAYYETKAYYNLLQDAEYILREKPDTAAGFVLKGLAETKLRKYDNALLSFNRAVELEPGNPEHLVNRGTVLYYQKKWREATSDFTRTLQLQPKEANALNALGLIAADQLKFDSARYYFDRALQLVPNQPFFLNNLGFVYLYQENFEKALELINLSITLDPDNAWAYRNKGIYYMLKQDHKNSTRLLKQALSMDDAVDRIHWYYATALLKAGDQSAGCDQLRIAIANSEGEVGKEIQQLCR